MNNNKFFLVFSVFLIMGVVFATDVNLSAGAITFNDSFVIYGETVDINIQYTNTGDANASEDYNISYYLNDALYALYTIDINSLDANFNVGDSDINTYSWDSNISGDIDVNICLSYFGDINSSDDCNNITLHVYSVDLNVTDMNADDTDANINYGEDVNVYVNFENSGDSNATESYDINYYFNGVLYQRYTLVDDLNVDNSDVNRYTWDSNIAGDVNVMVCIDYADYDNNSSNDCDSQILHVRSVDFNVSVSVSDDTINYGDDINLIVAYTNKGDANASEDYNIIYYIEGTAEANYLFSTDINTNNSDSNRYLWDSDIVGDTVDINVCVIYSGYDVNSINSCGALTVDVNAVDLKSKTMTLASTSVVEGGEVTAYFDYQNIGDATATASYTIKFYRDSTLLTGDDCDFTETDDLGHDEGVNDVECTFTAPSVSSTTTYTIKGVITYSGYDSDSANNDDATVTLTVTNSSSGSSSSGGGSSSSSTKKVDFKADSFTIPEKLKLSENNELIFKIKNIGTLDSFEKYTLKITSLLGESTKTICTESSDNEIGINEYRTFKCNWKPEVLGKYTLTASVTYDGSELLKTNNTLTKNVDVGTTTATTNTDINKLDVLEDINFVHDENVIPDIGIVLDDENKIEQILLEDENKPLVSMPVKLTLPDGNVLDMNTDANGYLSYDFNMQGKYYLDYVTPDGNSITKVITVATPIVTSAGSSSGSKLLLYFAIIILFVIVALLISWLIRMSNNAGRPRSLASVNYPTSSSKPRLFGYKEPVSAPRRTESVLSNILPKPKTQNLADVNRNTPKSNIKIIPEKTKSLADFKSKSKLSADIEEGLRPKKDLRDY